MKQLISPIIVSLFVITSLVCGQINDERASVPIPAAVPVVSQDEAKKANNEALKAASRRPINGTIKAISHTISPETAAYDNCNFVLVLRSDSGEEYVITVPMFINRQFTPFALLKEGHPLNVVIMPYEETSNEIQEIQTIDDINDFEKDMYYVDAIDKDYNTGLLMIDPRKKDNWLEQLRAEVEQEINHYYLNIKENKDELEKELENFKSGKFIGLQKSYGYFYTGNYQSNTNHYNQTLLQGMMDLQEKCKSFNCTLVVVPCIAENEYAKKELISSAESLPFIDIGRELFVTDCLREGILALDTNKIIRNHLSRNYLPHSMTGDGHFSKITNLFVADLIASSLDIKTNDYTIKSGYFNMSSVHLPFYSGPQAILLEPIFKNPLKSEQDSPPAIVIAGDSFTSTNSFNSYLSSLTEGKITTIRHDARANTTLQELLEGKYDTSLKDASLVVFIFSAAYMKGNYPTQDLINCLSQIKNNEVPFYNVPISGSPKSLTINRPDFSADAETIKLLVQIDPIISKYTLKVKDKTLFEYDCDFRYNGGDNNLLLNLSSEDFLDGKVVLSIDGNATFKRVVLIASSEHNSIQKE